MPDKFPEAFRRFERTVDVDRIETFRQLKLAFGSWAGQKWLNTYRQNEALKVEAKKLGVPVVVEWRPSVAPRGVAHVPERVVVTWRHETVIVKGSFQQRYRDLKTRAPVEGIEQKFSFFINCMR